MSVSTAAALLVPEAQELTQTAMRMCRAALQTAAFGAAIPVTSLTLQATRQHGKVKLSLEMDPPPVLPIDELQSIVPGGEMFWHTVQSKPLSVHADLQLETWLAGLGSVLCLPYQVMQSKMSTTFAVDGKRLVLPSPLYFAVPLDEERRVLGLRLASDFRGVIVSTEQGHLLWCEPYPAGCTMPWDAVLLILKQQPADLVHPWPHGSEAQWYMQQIMGLAALPFTKATHPAQGSWQAHTSGLSSDTIFAEFARFLDGNTEAAAALADSSCSTAAKRLVYTARTEASSPQLAALLAGNNNTPGWYSAVRPWQLVQSSAELVPAWAPAAWDGARWMMMELWMAALTFVQRLPTGELNYDALRLAVEPVNVGLAHGTLEPIVVTPLQNGSLAYALGVHPNGKLNLLADLPHAAGTALPSGWSVDALLQALTEPRLDRMPGLRLIRTVASRLLRGAVDALALTAARADNVREMLEVLEVNSSFVLLAHGLAVCIHGAMTGAEPHGDAARMQCRGLLACSCFLQEQQLSVTWYAAMHMTERLKQTAALPGDKRTRDGSTVRGASSYAELAELLQELQSRFMNPGALLSDAGGMPQCIMELLQCADSAGTELTPLTPANLRTLSKEAPEVVFLAQWLARRSSVPSSVPLRLAAHLQSQPKTLPGVRQALRGRSSTSAAAAAAASSIPSAQLDQFAASGDALAFSQNSFSPSSYFLFGGGSPPSQHGGRFP